MKMLFFSNALDHPLTSRMHFFIRFLEKRNIEARVFDVSFYYKQQSFFSFIKNIFSFPSKVFNQNHGTIQLPSLPLVGQRNSAIRPLLNSFYAIISFLLTRITSTFLEYNVIVTADPVSALIANFAKKNGIFVVYDDLDYFEDLKTGKILRFVISFLEKLAIIKANLVISVSRPLLKRACELNKNCILVPNGANLETFPAPQNVDRDKSIVYAGTLEEWAGLKLVIEAFPLIDKKIPNLQLKIMGDGKEKKSLESLVSSLSLQKRVFFLGRLPYAKMAELLCKSSIGVAMFKPGNAANFASPLKLFDYMGAGLSIIATNVGDIGRIVRESKSGYAINWNIDEFTEVVEKIIRNKKLWKKFHENGLRYVENYDWDTLFSTFVLEIEKRIQKQDS